MAWARTRVAKDAEDAIEDATLGYLDVLETVDQALSDVTRHIDGLYATCNDIDSQLTRADESTRYLLEHADGLRKQRSATAQNATLLDAFLARFTLTEAQREAIEAQSLPAVGPLLFEAMDRLEAIRADCHVLLVGREEGQQGGMRAGIDIMDETASLMDRAQNKVAKWLAFELRTTFREGQEVGSLVRESVKRLESREDLLRPALKALASTRAKQLSNAFQMALTVGGPAPSFLPRPIELHAHDPMRYVGDMLAWVHQSVASEREFLLGLFSRLDKELQDSEGRRRVGERRRGLEGSIDYTRDHNVMEQIGLTKGEIWTREVLDRVLEGCGRPLKVRIEQTVTSQEGCITTFRLASLIQFYRVTMERTIGSKAALSKTLSEISQISYRAFLNTLDNLAAGLSRFHQTPESDLGPSPPLLGACATLKELLAVHQSTLSEQDLFGDTLPLGDDDGNDAAGKEAGNVASDIGPVLARLVDAMLELCVRCADTLLPASSRRKQSNGAAKELLDPNASVDEDSMSHWNRSIYLLNCLMHMRTAVVEPYESTLRSTKVKVDRELTRLLADLTGRHHRHLARQSGLSVLVMQPAKRGEEKEWKRMQSALETFLNSGAALLASPELRLLQSPSARSAVHGNALKHLADDYKTLVETDSAPSSTTQELNLRTVEEVRVLLGVESESSQDTATAAL